MLTTISVTALESDYVEGETAQFRIDVSDASGPSSLGYQISGGPAGPTSGTFNYSSGSTSAFIDYPTSDNTAPDDSHTLTLEITQLDGNPSGPFGSASTQITDNDGTGSSGPTGPSGGDPPELNLGLGAPWEEAGAMYFAVAFSHTTDQVVSFTVEVRNASGALASDDWEVATTTVWVAANEPGFFNVWVPIDDVLIEGPEDFTFTISNPINAVLGSVVSQTMTLEDNDLPTTIDINVTPLDGILANNQVDEGEGFRVSGLVFDPSTPSLAEVLLRFDLNFDGDTDDDGEEVEATLTPSMWPPNYYTFSVDVGPVLDDGPSGPWSNETESDTITVIATLMDADSDQTVIEEADVEVFNFALQFLADPEIEVELDSQGFVVSATVSGSFMDLGLEDHHQVTVSWGEDQQASDEALLAIGTRTFSIARTFLEGSQVSAEDLFPIVVVVTDDDSGADSRFFNCSCVLEQGDPTNHPNSDVAIATLYSDFEIVSGAPAPATEVLNPEGTENIGSTCDPTTQTCAVHVLNQVELDDLAIDWSGFRNFKIVHYQSEVKPQGVAPSGKELGYTEVDFNNPMFVVVDGKRANGTCFVRVRDLDWNKWFIHAASKFGGEDRTLEHIARTLGHEADHLMAFLQITLKAQLAVSTINDHIATLPVAKQAAATKLAVTALNEQMPLWMKLAGNVEDVRQKGHLDHLTDKIWRTDPNPLTETETAKTIRQKIEELPNVATNLITTAKRYAPFTGDNPAAITTLDQAITTINAARDKVHNERLLETINAIIQDINAL